MKTKVAQPHIGIYGKRNSGKSSFINTITGQNISIVSDFAGTTTDPVKKSYEITGFGAVVLIDTAGVDDEGELGQKRIEKTLASIKTIDLAVLLISNNSFDETEEKLIAEFTSFDIPFVLIHNKADIQLISEETIKKIVKFGNIPILNFSTFNPDNLNDVIKTVKQTIPETAFKTPSLVGDLLKYGDIVLLITPIDIEAPEGRLILPQIQTIRDILDNDCVSVVVKEREVDAFLRKTGIKPALAITDSQIFLKADAMIPKDIPLTGFSVLFAKYKGAFDYYLQGTPKISDLKDGDRVLMLESCTHHVSCDDIGRVKIPRWISNFTGKKLEYDVVAGLSQIQRPIADYALVVQCGGCMITRKQIYNRLKPAIDAKIPITNYGMAIAWVQGIYKRAVAPFLQEDAVVDYL